MGFFLKFCFVYTVLADTDFLLFVFKVRVASTISLVVTVTLNF